MQPAAAVTGNAVLNFQQCQIMWGALRFLLQLLGRADGSSTERCEQVGRHKMSGNGDGQKQPLQCLRGGIVSKGKVKITDRSTADKTTRLQKPFKINFVFSSSTSKLIKSVRSFGYLISKLSNASFSQILNTKVLADSY